VNFQLLQITINVAVKNLETLVMDRAAIAKSAPVAATQPAPVARSAKTEPSSDHLNRIVESSMSSGMI
jgi:hypothetical protein